MRIGQAAVSSGLSVDTIRFYEREGLISQKERNAAGYRLYREEDILRLRSIGRAQTLGFTLQEIRDLFLFDGKEGDGCARVKEMINIKLAQVREKLKSLEQIENRLCRAQASCHAVLTLGEHCRCPLLQQLHEEE